MVLSGIKEEATLTDKPETITGGCLCGAIRYQSDAPPYRVGYCHCKMCQKGLGNLFATSAFFKLAGFRYLKNSPDWYTADGARRGFCSTCGSPIAFQRLGFEDEYTAIWLGTLDNPAAFEPTVEYHLESRLPWVDMGHNLQDGTPQGDRSRYDEDPGERS